ncbi:MAG TPA: T9SS type A sorting domain-containing protein [Bacteroidia bacterium]|nr:T9SS type A sorting domain-containing protein [Bacteroidia bacterium]
MKKIVLGISLIKSTFTFAQTKNGLEKIIVEKYYVSNSADSVQADTDASDNGISTTGALPIGSITYRIYADLLPGYKLLSVYADGTRDQPLIIKTSTSFYNHPFGLSTPNTIKKSGSLGIVNNPILALDSYLSLGAAATGYFGIPVKDDDATGNFFTNSTPGNVLQNFVSTVMDKALTEVDGYAAGTGFPTPSMLGISNTMLDKLGDGFTIGDSIGVADGLYYSTSGARGVDTVENKVLIAQLTTNGKLEFHLNITTQFGTDIQQYFVARNAQPAGTNPSPDIIIPSLNYPDSTATNIDLPTVKTYDDVQFSVYPNPVNEQFTIDLTASQPHSKGSYTLYGLIGNVIAHKELNSINGNYKETIDISSFAKGLYTIQMNVNGVTSTKKIIKN